jgi:hypothetical protein
MASDLACTGSRPWKSRPLAEGEKGLVRAVFGDTIESDRVRVLREKFVFFQPRDVTMAPDGNIWFHPDGRLAQSPLADDFSQGDLSVRAHFIHEMTHVWQRQQGIDPALGKFLMFFRYGAMGGYAYEITPGKSFTAYNIEQQACIVADLYRARCGGEGFRCIPPGTPWCGG